MAEQDPHGASGRREHGRAAAACRGRRLPRPFAWAGAALALTTAALLGGAAVAPEAPAGPPQTLQETGLYADAATLRVDPRHLAFSPQYPLWSDGAGKRRWISLPPGASIDGSDPDAWRFPVGTRLWKEFSFGGRPIETRFMQLQANGQWLYAAYAWSPDGREARLAPEAGLRGAFPLGNGRSHMIPAVSDCTACHQGGRTEVLGFSTLQLSPDRDPGAVHAEPRPAPGVDLRYLARRGLLKRLPKALLEAPPRIAAATPAERAALGYLHGNCGHCHNAEGSMQNVGLVLRQGADQGVQPAIASTFGRRVVKPAPGQSKDAVMRIEPGHPDRSALMQRISSRYAALQMPPLGTELKDEAAMTLVRRWIAEAGPASPGNHQGEKNP